MNVCVTSLKKDLGNESEREKSASFLPNQPGYRLESEVLLVFSQSP